MTPVPLPSPAVIARALILALAAALAGIALPAASTLASAATATSPAEDDRRVIIEFDGPSALEVAADQPSVGARAAVVQAHQATLRHRQEQVLESAAQRGLRLEVERSFDLAFNGAAATLDVAQVERLERLDGVSAVHKDRTRRVALESGPEHIGAPDVWDREDDGGNPATGVGQTIAILDTGVDYTHTDLGGAFGPGEKVIGGYDFVNDDDDPMDDHGHGTHVAATAAGDGKLTGVAPGASITAYKVLAASGAGQDTDIIAAIEEAADPANPHRADVINMSLGGPGDPDDPVARASDAAAASGVTVIASAGNDGPGQSTVGAPAVAKDVLAVGASTSDVAVPTVGIVAPEDHDLEAAQQTFSGKPPRDPVVTEVVDVGEGHPADYSDVDVEDKAVTAISGFDVRQQAVTAQEEGALAILFRPGQFSGPGPIGMRMPGSFDASPSSAEGADTGAHHQFAPRTDPSIDDSRLDVVAVDLGSSGVDVLEPLLDEGPVEVELGADVSTDDLANFSSRGPTGDFDLKPDVTAPGVDIVAAVPGDHRVRLSGTSMAAPHVAGGAALARQLNPERSEAEIRAMLTTTAVPLDVDVLGQGAGRIDLTAAVETEVTASPASVSLRLADVGGEEIARTGETELTNHGDEPVAFTLSTDAQHGAASVTPESLTLDPGEAESVTVEVSADNRMDNEDITGWVVAEANDAADVRVPYHLASRVLELHVTPDPIIDRGEVFIHSVADLADDPEVTVTGEDGSTTTVTAEHDHEGWWRAPVPDDIVGVHRVEAAAPTSDAFDGVTLAGASHYEVLDPEAADAAGWESIGPNSYGGHLTTTPANPDRLAANWSGPLGFSLTDDRGEEWTQFNRFPGIAGGHGPVALDPVDDQRMYYAPRGDSGREDPTYVGRLFKTDDAGRSWTTVDFPDVALEELEVDDAGTVLAGISASAVHVSADRGASWEELPAPWSGPRAAEMVGDDLYVAASDALWVLRDVATPRPRAEELWTAESGFIDDLAVDEDVIVVGGGQSGLQRSLDGGETWSVIDDRAGWQRANTYDLVDGALYTSTSSDLRASDDFGETWQEWEHPHPGSILENFAGWPGAANAQELLVGAGAAGVYETQDGSEAYERLGVPGITVNALAVAEDGASGDDVLLAGTPWSTYRTELPGPVPADADLREWGTAEESTVGSSTPLVETAPDDATTVWRVRTLAWSIFEVQRSDDGGETWEVMAETDERPTALLVHPADPDRVYVGFWSLRGAGLLRTEDGGESWRELWQDTVATALAGDPDDADRIWLGSGEGLWRSDDSGESAEQLGDERISALHLDADASDRLLVGGESLWVSDDGGVTLERTADTDLGLAIADFAVGAGPDEVYAASGPYADANLPRSGRGVLRSTDGGASWENISHGMDNRAVVSVEVSPAGGQLFAGTVDGGVHRFDLSPPALTVDAPADGTAVLDGEVRVAGEATDALSGVEEVIVDGDAVDVDEDGRFATVVALDPGPGEVTVTSTDAVGNETTETRTVASLDWQADWHAPEGRGRGVIPVQLDLEDDEGERPSVEEAQLEVRADGDLVDGSLELSQRGQGPWQHQLRGLASGDYQLVAELSVERWDEQWTIQVEGPELSVR